MPLRVRILGQKDTHESWMDGAASLAAPPQNGQAERLAIGSMETGIDAAVRVRPLRQSAVP